YRQYGITFDLTDNGVVVRGDLAAMRARGEAIQRGAAVPDDGKPKLRAGPDVPIVNDDDHHFYIKTSLPAWLATDGVA
ncbi:hypothetical protein, partial [Acinetobacter baumannii]